MAASEQVSANYGRLFVLGEVSLDGSLRPVAGVLPLQLLLKVWAFRFSCPN